MNVWAVLAGAGTTTLGLVVGSLFERWRDNTKWRRDEEARWTTDLRVLYRDLIAAGDQFTAHMLTARRLESRAKAERAQDQETDRLVKQMTDTYDGMQAELDKVASIAAEIALIGSTKETEATAGFRAQLLVASVLYDDEGEVENLRAGYLAARGELVEVARSVLRRV